MTTSPSASSLATHPSAGPNATWGWVAWGGFAVALAVLYRDTAVQLVETWETDPNYSHGYLIPLGFAYFAYSAWKRVGAPFRDVVPREDMWLGVFEVVLGFGVHIVGWYISQPLFDILGLVFILRGLCLVMGGKEVNQAYGFAAIFLLFAAPLPMAVYQPLAVFLQELVSIVSTFVLELFQVPVYREGYRLQLPNYYMDVGPACSGMRQITAFLALGVILAHVSDRGWAYKIVVGLLGLPIAIATNCVRVVLTGFILLLAGPKWAEGVFHTIEGLLMLALGTVLMVTAALFLANLDDLTHWGGRRPGENDAGKANADEARAGAPGDADIATEIT